MTVQAPSASRYRARRPGVHRRAGGRGRATATGRCCCRANAGSGKTSVLVERFVRAVLEDGHRRPARILAITFTDKAAGELRERVRARLLELGEREAARETEGAWVSTIHGFCARVLRAHAVAAGLDPRFAVLDEPRAARAARARRSRRALRGVPRRGRPAAALDLVAAYSARPPARPRSHDVHDALRSRGRRRPALPAGRAAPGTRRRARRRCAAARRGRRGRARRRGRRAGKVDEARDALDRCARAPRTSGGDASRPRRALRRR